VDVDPTSAPAVSALREVILAGERYRRAASNYLGLDIGGSQAVSYLYSHGPMGPGELGALLGYTTASVTALLDRLEKENLAHRRPHPTDRRRSIVELTDHGVEAVRATGRWLVRSFDQVDPNMLATVVDVLVKIAQGLGEQAVDLAEHRNNERPRTTAAVAPNSTVSSVKSRSQ
jgi:DNA-binding MarR family transcriptional regulator